MRKEVVSAIAVLCMTGLLMAAPADKDGQGPDKKMDHKMMMHKGGRPEMGCPMMGMMDPKFLVKKLGLSKDQSKSLEKIKAETDKLVIPLGIDMKMAHKDLKELLFAETLDEAKVTEINGKLADIQKKMFDAHLAAIKSVRGILTPEQLKKLSELPDEMKEKMGKKGWGKKKGIDDEECDMKDHKADKK